MNVEKRAYLANIETIKCRSILLLRIFVIYDYLYKKIMFNYLKIYY